MFPAACCHRPVRVLKRRAVNVTTRRRSPEYRREDVEVCGGVFAEAREVREVTEVRR